MTLLTSEQIKTQLETIDFSTVPVSIKRINAYVEKNESHRKYPTIDIQNITGQEEIEGQPTVTTKQIFLVNLYWRTRATGADQEPKIKSTEDLIFNSLDSLQTMSTKVQVIQGWDRKSETFPLARVVSTIRVESEEISSDDGSGILGNEITILIGAVGPFDVNNVLSDESGILKDLDLTVDSDEIFTRIRNNGILSVEIAVSVASEDSLKTLIFAGVNINITFTKGGVADVRVANLINMVASGPRTEVQKQVITMDILN